LTPQARQQADGFFVADELRDRAFSEPLGDTHDGLDDGVALDSFRSHYELRRPPRGPENRATAIHMALSMFQEPEACWNLIERTRGKIGDHVAELRLTPAAEFASPRRPARCTGRYGRALRSCTTPLQR
jgi:hypothetical protein